MRTATQTQPIDHQARREAVRAFLRGDKPSLDRTGYHVNEYTDRDALFIQLRENYDEVRQFRAQSVNVNTAGGYLQPSNFEDSLEIALLWYDAFRPFATVDRVENGGETRHPTINDTNQVGQIVPENTQMSSNDFTQFGDVAFRPWKYGSLFILIPNELNEDVGDKLDVWLGTLIGQRIGRIQAKDWTNRVLIPQATQAGTATSHTTISYVDVMALENSVDPFYRMSPTCGWMCHPTVRQNLKEVYDAQARPIFVPRRRPDEPDCLDGYFVTYNPYLPSTLAAGNQCLFFGDWSKIHIRDVRETRIVRLKERFAEFDQEAAAGFLRSDCALMDAGTHPIQYLLQ